MIWADLPQLRLQWHRPLVSVLNVSEQTWKDIQSSTDGGQMRRSCGISVIIKKNVRMNEHATIVTRGVVFGAEISDDVSVQEMGRCDFLTIQER